MTADLAAIRARLAAATPGPWVAETSEVTMDDRSLWRMRRDTQPQVPLHLSSVMSSANADLIASAPADLAALCDEVEALTARAERAESAIQRVRDRHTGVGNCDECGWMTPCPTLRALDGAE